MNAYLANDCDIEALVDSAAVVVIEISNMRCGACAAIEHKLKARYEADERVALYDVLQEATPGLCASLNIYASPAVLVYVEGRLVIKEAGYFSVEDIFSRVERYLTLLEG